MKNNWAKIRELVLNTDKTILTKAIMVDGHTIYKPEKFTETGLDPTIVAAFTKTLKSGNHPKEMIEDTQGNYAAEMNGVYGLEILEFIANVFNVTSWKMGRGSRAQHLIEQLTETNFTVQTKISQV